MTSNGRLPYLVGSLILTAILVGSAWGLVYAYAVKPLMEEGGLRLSHLETLSPASLAWWRDFIALSFDILILAVAAIGTWWVLATFAAEAPEAGKWWRYYHSPQALSDTWLPRLSAWQRLQHIWILITFTISAVTGFAAWADVLADRATLLTIHVYSGIAMGVLALLHFGYYTTLALLAKARGESLLERFPMLEIFSKRFLRNVARVLLGRKPEPYGKYDPEQLFEYWGVYWGMAVLGIPGLVMLLYGPDVLGGIFWVTHTKEAVLATSFILMVHIAYTHARPKAFPMDPTFLSGKMPLRRALEEHPRWATRLLEELGLAKRAAAKPEAEAPAPTR
jgi:cytochrome b subunit of formate dehydrogenase